MKNILVVPDPHAKHGISNERFTWLGRVITHFLPDIIVCLGDLADFESLSSFEKGKKSFEGRRYKKDVEAVHDALAKIQAPIDEYNKTLASKKVKKYNPERIMLTGNHENRVNRAVEADSMLDGTIGIEDLKYEKFGWEVVPFLKTRMVEGIAFQHYFTSGLMDKSIGGENLGKTILKKNHASSIQGHSHVLSLAFETTIDGRRLFGGSAGCYFEHDEHYVTGFANSQWWRGLILLRGVENGYPNHGYDAITMERIKKEFKK